jgi:hypothetical protein
MASIRQKQERTQEKEAQAIDLCERTWVGVRVDQVNTPMNKDFVEKRLNGFRLRGRRSRIVDFNPQLEALVKEMGKRRAPDSG